MTVTLTVTDLNNRTKRNIKTNGVFFVSGLLWLDTDEAKLYNWQDDHFLPLNDPEACQILRSHFCTDYLGGALLQTWVRDKADGLELYNLYWVVCGDLQNDPPSKWGAKIIIRPVPEEYDCSRNL